MTHGLRRPSWMVAGEKMKKAIAKVVKAHGYKEEYETSKQFHLRIKNEPWMALVIERIGEQVSVCHYAEMNGDLIQDPEIVFELANWEAVEVYTFFGGPHSKYREIDGVRKVNVRFDNKVYPLTRVWAENILAQGFADADHAQAQSSTHPHETERVMA